MSRLALKFAEGLLLSMPMACFRVCRGPALKLYLAPKVAQNSFFVKTNNANKMPKND
jgi:hypothetical protein